MTSKTNLPDDYPALLDELKKQIKSAQIKAALSVNKELILLYWNIGKEILNRQEKQGWGSKIIEKLSKDLRMAFPESKGYSTRNLKYMRAFAEAWPDKEFVHQVGAQIPWKHNVLIFEKLKDNKQRLWYSQQTIVNCWSRAVLEHQIEVSLFQRQVESLKSSNFEHTLPQIDSDLANQLIKDPFSFDFLSLAEDHKESELQKALVQHLRSFLLELGLGFAFVGENYHLEVEGIDYYIDLLFYHYKLKAFIVIELKARTFDPRDVGQLNFYLSAVDELIREPNDNKTIGLILCKDKKGVSAEYALRGLSQPMGITKYQTKALPKNLKDNLPSITEIEIELKNTSS
ncbi:UNVERIFIED_CONTAM: hypothetical protein GTU68_052501 [Idotea baltica]|nr:hypothetical protein [Idotea baltica]